MYAAGCHELNDLDEATRMLGEAKSLEEIKAIRDRAETARAYATAARLGLELRNRAAVLKLRAERKAGIFLASLKLRGGDRRSKGRRALLTLTVLGISRDQSKRWQHIASISEADFVQYVKYADDLGRDVTSTGLLRIAKQARGVSRVNGSRPADRRSPMDRASSPRRESLCELMGHCQLVADVLQPLFEGGNVELKRVERTLLRRALDEMRDLLGQLHNQ